MSRRIGRVARTLEDKADTSRHLSLSIICWILSFILCEIEYKLYGS